MIYQNLGVLEGYRPNPDYEKIHQLNLKNLEIMERCIGDNPQDMRLTFCLENVASNLHDRKDYDRLEEFMWRACKLYIFYLIHFLLTKFLFQLFS